MAEKAELLLAPLTAGYCPDSAFCIKMGGCMSGCTSGPGYDVAPRTDDSAEFTPVDLQIEDAPVAVGALEQVIANREALTAELA